MRGREFYVGIQAFLNAFNRVYSRTNKARTDCLMTLTGDCVVSRHGAVELLVSQRVPGPVKRVVLRVGETATSVLERAGPWRRGSCVLVRDLDRVTG